MSTKNKKNALLKLALAIPCYNEEGVIEETAKRLRQKMVALIQSAAISSESRIIFLDDGSKDKTWKIIERLHEQDGIFGGIKMSRNRGHQNVLFGGLMTLKDSFDAVISMDADLQDDIDALDDMIREYRKGADIVYGVRKERTTDSAFKRSTALAFYRVMEKMGVDSVYNHADYRLMSRRSLQELAHFHEVNLFLRGIVPLLGFRTAKVYYDRAERYAGESKYPLRKMINFAIDGITSFSVKPLRMITGLGFLIATISVLVAIYLVVMKFIGTTGQGLSFIAVSIWFIGGLQMLSLGVIGEYIGKIYTEAKGRPRYIVEKKT